MLIDIPVQRGIFETLYMYGECFKTFNMSYDKPLLIEFKTTFFIDASHLSCELLTFEK